MSDEMLLEDDPARYWEMMFKDLARENSRLMERCGELEEKVNLLVDSINRQRLECCEQGKNLNEANYRLWEAVKPMLQEGVRRMRSKKIEAGGER